MAHLTDLPEIPADPHPRVPRWLPDLIVAAVITAVALLPSPLPEFSPANGWVTALVLSPILVLQLRRRWPVTTLVVLLIVFGVAAAAGTLSPGVGIAVAVAMFQIAIRGSRRRGLIIGGIAIVVIMLLTLLASIGTVIDPRVFQFGLGVALATAAGDGVRSRKAYIEAITERADRAVETREAEAQRRVTEERLRIARDLHDAVAHQIAVISLNAGVASSAIHTRPEKAKASLATIREAARTVLNEIGDLMTMLRNTEEGTQQPTPQVGLDHLDTLVTQFGDAGLTVQTRIEGDLSRVSGAADLVAYRGVQEALTNAHKHGAEHRAHVLLTVGDHELTIAVTNPMSDRATRPSDQSSGLGLIGLRERVASVRGTVDAGPTPAGWRVLAQLPLTKEDAR